MARLPHAAKTLTKQVREHMRRSEDSKAGMETARPEGDPDGLGVYRALRFDKTSSKWLAKVLEQIDDERIESVETDKGQVVVKFTHRTAADRRDPFPLDDAEVVADEGDQ